MPTARRRRSRRLVCANPQRRGGRGAVLLEIVLSLVLFFSASTIILAGLHSAIRGLGNIKLDAQAADLAITLLSRIQIGEVELTDAGPNPFEVPAGPVQELDGWTWQVVTAQMQETLVAGDVPGKLVEIVVRNEPREYTYRLSEWIPTDENGQALTATTQPAGTEDDAQPAPEGQP